MSGLLKIVVMPRRIGLVITAILFCSCSEAPSRQLPREPSAILPSNAQPLDQIGPGAFRVIDLGVTADGTSRYMATTDGDPPTCQFEIVIEKSKPASDARFSFAEAALLRQPESECTAFLRALAEHLGFKGELPKPQLTDRLSGTLAVLGRNQSRQADREEVAGGFSSTPAGHWTAAKFFLADGEGEVYLNINAQERVGEFSIKDEDYATSVVTELAKILLPMSG